MRANKPVLKSFGCAAGIFVVLYSILYFFDMELILWRGEAWAVVGLGCALSGLTDGLWASYSSRSWSWIRHIITCIGFCIVWFFVIHVALFLKWRAHPTLS
jgi:hypothetical protein